MGLYLAALIFAILVGGWFRFAQLGERPMHADEATGAKILSERLESGDYSFDPTHFHGPSLTALASIWCSLAGEDSWEELTAKRLRMFTAICGMLAIGLIAFFGLFGMGKWSQVLAISFGATSPFLVYYSRMFIHESLLLVCTAIAVFGWLLVSRGKHLVAGAVIGGMGLGVMAATRETFIITSLAWFVALWWLTSNGRLPQFCRRSLLIGAGCSLGVIVLFYGRDLPALVQTYFTYEVTEGHEKAMSYYWDLLVWPHKELGRWWSEGLILLLAGGLFFSDQKKRNAQEVRLGIVFLGIGLFHLIVYSLIGYKTPWLMLVGWWHLCLAAGVGTVVLIQRSKPAMKPIWVILVMVALGWHGVQAQRATFRFPNDGRNPYAYVPTQKDVVQLSGWLTELKETTGMGAEDLIAVLGEQIWPLPWYLRDHGAVGYWQDPPEEMATFPILIIFPSVQGVILDLEATHVLIPRGIRDQVPIWVAVRNDVWERYQETE